MFRKSSPAAIVGGKMDNILGPNTSYNGTIRSDGNVRIDGIYQGCIETSGNVIIGPSAKVLATIVANAVQVWGAIRGNITARERLEILPTGRVWGDIRVHSLLIDEGGMFRGQCAMAGGNEQPTALLTSDTGQLPTGERSQAETPEGATS